MKLIISHEVRLRYTWGYFRYKQPGIEAWQWYICHGLDYDETEVPNNDIQKCLRVRGLQWYPSLRRWKETKLDLSKVILDLSIPQLGYINGEFSAEYLIRMTHKQWCRVLKRDTVANIVPQHIAQHVSPKMGGWDGLFIEQYEQPYPDFKTCINWLIDGEKLSAAFAKDYMVGISPHGTQAKLWVYLKNKPVGVVDKIGGEYVVAVPRGLDYIVEDLMQYCTALVYY